MGGILLPDGVTHHDVSQEIHPGQLIHHDKETITGDFVNNTTSTWTSVTGGTSGALQIAYTPPVDCIVVAHAEMVFSASGSVNQIAGRIEETEASTVLAEQVVYYPTASKTDSMSLLVTDELTKDTLYTFEVQAWHSASGLTVEEEDERTHFVCEFYAAID